MLDLPLLKILTLVPFVMPFLSSKPSGGGSAGVDPDSLKDFLSAITFADKSVTTAKDQTLVCQINGLTLDSAVTFVGPDNKDISTNDPNNYVVSQGNFKSGAKESTLQIKVAKLATLTTKDKFKCKLKSALYPVDSPEVVKEMTKHATGFAKSANPRRSSNH